MKIDGVFPRRFPSLLGLVNVLLWLSFCGHRKPTANQWGILCVASGVPAARSATFSQRRRRRCRCHDKISRFFHHFRRQTVVPSAISSGDSTDFQTFDVAVHTNLLRLVPKFQQVSKWISIKEVRKPPSFSPTPACQYASS